MNKYEKNPKEMIRKSSLYFSIFSWMLYMVKLRIFQAPQGFFHPEKKKKTSELAGGHQAAARAAANFCQSLRVS